MSGSSDGSDAPSYKHILPEQGGGEEDLRQRGRGGVLLSSWEAARQRSILSKLMHRCQMRKQKEGQLWLWEGVHIHLEVTSDCWMLIKRSLIFPYTYFTSLTSISLGCMKIKTHMRTSTRVHIEVQCLQEHITFYNNLFSVASGFKMWNSLLTIQFKFSVIFIIWGLEDRSVCCLTGSLMEGWYYFCSVRSKDRLLGFVSVAQQVWEGG